MTTWAGWAAYLLGADGVDHTASNVAFLEEWASHADNPSCAFNPIDLTHKVSDSTNCAASGFADRYVQAYSARYWARTAFYAQLETGKYPHLFAALKSGNPYTYADWSGVVGDLGEWTSGKFARVWLARYGPAGQGGVTAAHAHGGWNDLRRSINHRMPSALRHSRRLNRAALRTLHRASKVRL